MTHETIETSAAMLAKTAPPIAVVGAEYIGITLPELVHLATLFYVGLMIVHKCWHMWKEWKTGKITPESEGELP